MILIYGYGYGDLREITGNYGDLSQKMDKENTKNKQAVQDITEEEEMENNSAPNPSQAPSVRDIAYFRNKPYSIKPYTYAIHMQWLHWKFCFMAMEMEIIEIIEKMEEQEFKRCGIMEKSKGRN